jgi:hypothetical protein
MKVTVIRIAPSNDDTIGMIFLNGAPHSFSMEDEYRVKKVAGETRIPAGNYTLNLRTFGGFHQRNIELFGFTDGMIEIKDVPNFTDVLFHWGNDEGDTKGCILMGNTARINRDSNGFVGQSREAYKDFYQKVAPFLRNGEQVECEIIDDITPLLTKDSR